MSGSAEDEALPTLPRVWSRWLIAYLYNTWALRFNMSYVWHCPADTMMLPLFRENFSKRHMDIGVASGYFPAVALALQDKYKYKTIQESTPQQIMLVDLHLNALEVAKARIESAVRRQVEIRYVEADVTRPVPQALQGAQFDSMSMYNLLHCVHGWPSKLKAIKIYAGLLSDDGVLTGCTILGAKYCVGILAKLTLLWFNWAKAFDNWDDDRETIDKALEESFEEVETWLVGEILLFRARKPRRA